MPVPEAIERLRSDLAGRVDLLEDFPLPFGGIKIVFKGFPTTGIIHHLPELSDHQEIKACLKIDTRPNYIPKEALIIFGQDQKPRVAIVSGQEDKTATLFFHQLDSEDREVDLIGVANIALPLYKNLIYEASRLLSTDNHQAYQLIITQTGERISLKPMF